MISITNPKVAGFVPRWAPFAGFSLLFDNPGTSSSPIGEGLLKADCVVDGDGGLELYNGFSAFLRDLGTERLTNTFLFCALPPYSYHVTVWDGLNDGNRHQIPPGHRTELEDFLKDLPDSLLTQVRFTTDVYQSPLITRTHWSIHFTFKELLKWSNQSLVAVLAPTDHASEREFERIVHLRAALSARVHERFGIQMQEGYFPHVTLGYFANEQDAEASSPHINHWGTALQKRVNRSTITFRSISLYGFTDMATFFKKAPTDEFPV